MAFAILWYRECMCPPNRPGFACLTLLVMLLALHVSVVAAKTATSTKGDNGAIAYHRGSGSYGYAVNRLNARDARIEALKQCGHAECEVVLSLKASCGAIAKGPRNYFASRGTTREEAETKARRHCGARCEVLVWACTQ